MMPFAARHFVSSSVDSFQATTRSRSLLQSFWEAARPLPNAIRLILVVEFLWPKRPGVGGLRALPMGMRSCTI